LQFFEKKKLMPKTLNRKTNMNKNEEIEFLRDFDLLTAPDPSETALYSSAKLSVAEGFMKDDYVLKEDGTPAITQELRTPSPATSTSSSASAPASTCCSSCSNS
jgi:hypothetical protein